MDADIEILGTRYSPTLRALYERVEKVFNLPITVTSIAGRVDNTFQVRTADIELRLKPGSTEDNVAHELMHGVLQSEGSPQMFSLAGWDLAEIIRSSTAGDFDHLVINDRLLELGYDARQGFMAKGDSYHKVLKLRAHEDPSLQTALLIILLHELMKFGCYYGDPTAESEIQRTFPTIRRYWRQLSAVIVAIPQKPQIQGVWDVANAYIRIVDQIASDRGCPLKPSNFIGFQSDGNRTTDTA